MPEKEHPSFGKHENQISLRQKIRGTKSTRNKPHLLIEVKDRGGHVITGVATKLG